MTILGVATNYSKLSQILLWPSGHSITNWNSVEKYNNLQYIVCTALCGLLTSFIAICVSKKKETLLVDIETLLVDIDNKLSNTIYTTCMYNTTRLWLVGGMFIIESRIESRNAIMGAHYIVLSSVDYNYILLNKY